MDPPLKHELREAAAKTMDLCLKEMEQHWLDSCASSDQMQKEWRELLRDTRVLPMKYKIVQTRKEIKILWEKCFRSEEEKLRFTAYYSDAYTPMVLNEHLEELQKLQKFYKENKELIGLIIKYEEMWSCVLKIQQQTQDPERLFKNRGAKLLQEEHDRKIISKIPHMQNSIMKLMKAKEAAGYPFLVRGERYAEIIEKHNAQQHGGRSLKRAPLSLIQSGEVSAKKNRPNENRTPLRLRKSITSLFPK